MPNKEFEIINNRDFYGSNIRNDIWGFTGQDKDCQDICAMIESCKAFVWKKWLCRILHSAQNYMCDESAIGGKITDESVSKSFETNSKIVMIVKG